jgi:hypothetical protein
MTPAHSEPIGRFRLLSLDARVALVCGTLMAPALILLTRKGFLRLTDWMDAEISKMAAAKWD